MRKLYFLLITLFLSIGVEASHIHSSQLRIEHISGFDYKIHLVIYRDATGIAVPPGLPVSVYEREGAFQINSFTLQRDTSYIVNPNILGCPTGILFDANEYSIVVTLPPTTYNHPGGYLFYWQSCCRNPGIMNVMNPSASGQAAITLFPALIDSLGGQIINSSPVLNTPIADFGINQQQYLNNFGGIDPDGDSLVYDLFTPFEDGGLTSGFSNPIFAPYTDPATQTSSVQWAPGFNQNDQIHGFPGPNPSPNRLKIDPITGEVTVTPNVNGNGIFIYGIVCKEYRNGKLIGVVYRDNVLYIVNNASNPISNDPPVVQTPQNQSLATWNGDTLIFTGSPVCVQLDVTDPDTLADIRLELIQSDYDPQDISFVQSSAVIQNGDTFSTALCFTPDSFLSIVSEAKVMAFDNICHNVKSDTLSFYFRFDGYSNAGAGGNIPIPITASLGNLDLFSYLNGNPNPGGTWLDLDNTGLLNNGQFDASGISSDVSYRFAYIDQQPNYPADTAELELQFFVVQSVTNDNELINTKVYPNPNSGDFIIEVPETLIGKRIVFYTLDFREVKSVILNDKVNTIELIETGMFIAKIEGSNEVMKVFVNP